ncbi:MAG: flavodoxin family protein [Kiritimatiellia bacterium]
MRAQVQSVQEPRQTSKLRLLICVPLFLRFATIPPAVAQGEEKSVLIVYHSGDPRYSQSPSLEAKTTDAFTHPTTREINVEIVARELQKKLVEFGIRAELRKVDAITHPAELLRYDGLVIGFPVWFSNMSYPVKRFFDTHLIRIYEHRPNRLADKVVSGFCTVMEAGESGPQAMQAFERSIVHLNPQYIQGLVLRTSEPAEQWQKSVYEFARRLSQTVR